MQGIVHSLLPSKLRNHSSPIPVHSSCCPVAVIVVVVLSFEKKAPEVLLLISSNAAPANAVAVEFRLSLTKDAKDSFPNPPSIALDMIIPVAFPPCPCPPSDIKEPLVLLLLEVKDEGENLGANQSPLRSTKHRSDHWQDDVKRIKSRAEQ